LPKYPGHTWRNSGMTEYDYWLAGIGFVFALYLWKLWRTPDE